MRRRSSHTRASRSTGSAPPETPFGHQRFTYWETVTPQGRVSRHNLLSGNASEESGYPLLYVVTRANFLFIQNQTELTPGNLSSHLSKLEAAAYLTIQKTFVGKMPRTFVKLTAQGRAAFESYRNQMREVFTSPPTVQDDVEQR